MNRKRLWYLQHRFAPYLFVFPFIVLFIVFMLYPLGRSLMLSFYQTIGPRHMKFIGLGNFVFLLKDHLFWGALANTASYVLAYLSVQIPASLGLALLMNSPFVRARSFFRFAFFSTHLVGQVFVAVLFAQLLSPRAGLLNRSLSLIMGRYIEIDWLGEPNLAMVSVLMASLWLSVGFGMIYFLAALQAVDKELYEAAMVDGAGRWSQFWNVTLPGIRPVLVFMIVVGTIGAFQLFELPFVLFQQTPGPDNRALTIVMYLFITGFQVRDLGLASAIGWALVLVIFAIALIQIRLSGVAKEN
jgi:ABC-type sugar transport system permease subunit